MAVPLLGLVAAVAGAAFTGASYTLVRAIGGRGEPPLVPVLCFATLATPLAVLCHWVWEPPVWYAPGSAGPYLSSVNSSGLGCRAWNPLLRVSLSPTPTSDGCHTPLTHFCVSLSHAQPPLTSPLTHFSVSRSRPHSHL